MMYNSSTYETMNQCKEQGLVIDASRDYLFSSCQMTSCSNKSNMSVWVVDEPQDVCYEWVDVCWGVIHLLIGIIGITLNSLALYVFIKIGMRKPYYVIIIFETLTDLIVSFVAIYSGIFLVAGRPSAFGQGGLLPLCVLAGLLWNWNMVTTPLLLSFAGLLRIRAVYFPHDTSILSSRLFIASISCCMYAYGIAFACFPYYFTAVKYQFFEAWSICDFMYDDGDQEQTFIYNVIVGPIPMLLSLLIILTTNIIIVVYLIKRYKKSWIQSNATNSAGVKKSDQQDDTIQSKQVVVSLLIMTVWYLMCYSVIIYHNFKNLLLNLSISEDPFAELGDMELTYFYATYNFCAFLNSFANPMIQLMSGNSFKSELKILKTKVSNSLSNHLRTAMSHTEDNAHDLGDLSCVKTTVTKNRYADKSVANLEHN